MFDIDIDMIASLSNRLVKIARERRARGADPRIASAASALTSDRYSGLVRTNEDIEDGEEVHQAMSRQRGAVARQDGCRRHARHRLGGY